MAGASCADAEITANDSAAIITNAVLIVFLRTIWEWGVWSWEWGIDK
jgi:hypothetical protein